MTEDTVGFEGWSPSDDGSYAGDSPDNSTTDYLTDNWYVDEEDLQQAQEDAQSGDFTSVTDYAAPEPEDYQRPSYGDGDPTNPADADPVATPDTNESPSAGSVMPIVLPGQSGGGISDRMLLGGAVLVGGALVVAGRSD